MVKQKEPVWNAVGLDTVIVAFLFLQPYSRMYKIIWESQKKKYYIAYIYNFF